MAIVKGEPLKIDRIGYFTHAGLKGAGRVESANTVEENKHIQLRNDSCYIKIGGNPVAVAILIVGKVKGHGEGHASILNLTHRHRLGFGIGIRTGTGDVEHRREGNLFSPGSAGDDHLGGVAVAGTIEYRNDVGAGLGRCRIDESSRCIDWV